MLSPPFSSEIIVFKVTPFTQFEHLRHLLDTPGLRCCIFECYHFAEMPHSDSVLELLKDS
jgi:lysophospholipase